MDDIAVSVICTAYNHEKYIKDALEGFVMQKTNFSFEILIHDDASTDKTADIIREYEKKYPTIIKPIYQSDNQYSKGINILKTYLYPKARGKYLAICEGDDFWTDEFKLQKQYDILESHLDIDGCAHAVKMQGASNGKVKGYIQPLQENGIIPIEDIIKGGGGFIGTNSLMYRIEIIKTQRNFYRMLSLDYVTQICMALRGGVYYLNDCMSVYRVRAEGSWTSRMIKNPRIFSELTKKIIDMLNVLDKETDFQYHTAIKVAILEHKGDMASKNGDIKSILSYPLKDWLSEQSFKKKIRIILRTIKNYGKKEI